jgi:ABC-type nitrate/sulfonate/bicarbonate transport system substrate-binding protein
MRRASFLSAAFGTIAGASMAPGHSAVASEMPFDFQLNWLMDAEYAGSYIAVARGYYSRQGVSPRFVAGGPQVAVIPSVVAGRALVGIASPDAVAAANSHGAGVRIIAAVYQKSPFGVLSLRAHPLERPVDLVGRRIGVPVKDVTMWNAFLRVNGIKPNQVDAVPAETDLRPLLARDVDGWLSYATNEPLALQLRGIETTMLLLHDFGFPMLQQAYVVRASSVEDAAIRRILVRFLRAEIDGWNDAMRDPVLGAQLAVHRFGAGIHLREEHQRMLAAAQVAFVAPRRRVDGPLVLDRADVAATEESLRHAGFTVTGETFVPELQREARLSNRL